ncbi:MAG TPA: DUF6285 domain-containing protein [Acidimicrobiia bacterium]|nr:DUF6285 domain-containing protein [Acidimicrobiia bacterium]
MTQDRPTAAELVEAVREFLDDARGALDGRLAFHARVAANALAIVERELRAGTESAEAQHARLRDLLGHDGALDDLERELASRIRDGSLDDRRAETTEHVRATVRDKLAIAHPGYVAGDSPDGLP